jgi:nucleotide-binding universal stress UspA family protein
MNAHHSRRTVVVGVDGSVEALRAVRWAAIEADRRKAVLRMVTALPWAGDAWVGLPINGQDRYGEYLREAGEKVLAAAVAVATEVVPELATEHALVLGNETAVLAEESQAAELLVVGDRGLGRFGALLAGSVAVAMAAHAACPVIVVRGEKRGEEAGVTAGDVPPVVVGIDATPTSEAAIAFAFDEAAARHAPLVAVHTWIEGVGDTSLAPFLDWDAATEEVRAQLAEYSCTKAKTPLTTTTTATATAS